MNAVPRHVPTDTTIVPPAPRLPAADRKVLFAKRMAAAQIDVVVAGVVCLVLFWSAGAFSAARHPLWKPTAAVLAALCLVELFTGHTPGKLATGLALRTPAGGRPPIVALVVRGLVRQVPIALFAATLYVHRQPENATIFFLAFLVACGYVSVSYIMLMRRGQTLFDAAAGTLLTVAGPRAA